MNPSDQAYVEDRIAADPNGGCWLWLLSLDKDGYGKSGDSRAHRVSYQAWNGEIPAGLVIDHKCRVRCCCNPAHLRAVTPSQNTMENSGGPALANSRKTHCPRGHQYDDANTRITVSGGNIHRACRACEAERRELLARPWAARTHCVNGHALEGYNLRVNHAGRRICRACMRLYQKNCAARKRIARVTSLRAA